MDRDHFIVSVYDDQPGEIHKLLLQLPWEDVYDTLLERTESPERGMHALRALWQDRR